MNTDIAADKLLDFIAGSPSSFHAAAGAKQRLLDAGFTELLPAQSNWQLQAGGRYIFAPYDSMLLAFSLGEKPAAGGLRIAAAHTDFPCFKLKPACSIAENGYEKLNIEAYGGMILNTWLDRPLSVAGKVALRGESPFLPDCRLVDFETPLLTIPNLAIHMNRDVNKGIALNRQKDMLPLAGLLGGETAVGEFFQTRLAEKIGCQEEAILAFDLALYPVETGCRLGFDKELISSPRLDNLSSVQACVESLLGGSRDNGINAVALFDHEEVGSRTKQGAGSLLFAQVLERVYMALGLAREDYLAALSQGYMFSVDAAHAVHPNVPEKSDPTNRPILNGGVVLKTSASQSYAGDCEAAAIAKALCQKYGIEAQHFVNRSDVVGGSTLGSIASTLLPIRTMDIGVGMLAMHSVREVIGATDQLSLENLLRVFFSEA